MMGMARGNWDDLPASSRGGDERALSAVRQLEERVDRLALVNMALWTIISKELKITEEELLLRVQEIDLRDGKLDGKLSAEVTDCAACGRKISKKHNRCLYCGKESIPDAFGTVL